MPTSPPTVRIALAMIVRDTIASPRDDLARAVASARPYVDAVVIVDTGSVDGTVALARSLADVFEERVFDDEWGFDFGRARSYSVELSERHGASYVLILDADEYLDPDDGAAWQDVRDRLTGAVATRYEGRTALPDCVEVTVMNRMDGGRAWEPHFDRRVLPARWRYHLRRHHYVVPFAENGMLQASPRLYKSEARIIHLGYDLTPEEGLAKFSARLKLSRRLLQECPAHEVPYYQYRYAQDLYHCEEWVEAFRAFRASLATVKVGDAVYGLPDHAGSLRHMVWCLLNLYPETIGTAEQALRLARRSVETAPDALSYFHAAQLCRIYGMVPEALAFLDGAGMAAFGEQGRRFDRGVIAALRREIESGEKSGYVLRRIDTEGIAA